jgi:hypothetical protein
MRKVVYFFLTLSLIFLLSTCKKSSTPAPNYPIVGLWIGTQVPNDGSTTVPLYYSFDLHSDSSILLQGLGADGNTYYALGKWSLSGTAFTAAITASNLSQAGAKQTLSAVYSSDKGTLSSGVVMGVGNNYTATFSMERTN